MTRTTVGLGLVLVLGTSIAAGWYLLTGAAVTVLVLACALDHLQSRRTWAADRRAEGWDHAEQTTAAQEARDLITGRWVVPLHREDQER